MKPQIGGTLIVHNAIERDYCVEAALESLIPLVDEVVVIDASSTDGTADLLHSIKARAGIPFRIINVAWSPNRLGRWLASLTNVAREALSSPYHLNLQADEVFEDGHADEIRSAASSRLPLIFRRLNFWFDNWHIAPPGKVCGHQCIRSAASDIPSVGDAEQLGARPPVRQAQTRIFHYGFIRRADGFVTKTKEMQQAFFNTVDPIVLKIPDYGMKALLESVPMQNLLGFVGAHPKVAHKWLSERGFNPLTP